MDRLLAGKLSRKLGLSVRDELPRDENGMQSIDEYLEDDTQDNIRFQQVEEDLLRQKNLENLIEPPRINNDQLPIRSRRQQQSPPVEPTVYQDEIDYNDFDYDNNSDNNDPNHTKNNDDDAENDSNKENDQSPFNYVARRINFDNNDDNNITENETNSQIFQINKSPALNKQSPLRSPLPEQQQQQQQQQLIQDEMDFDYNQFDNDDYDNDQQYSDQHIDNDIRSHDNINQRNPSISRESSPSLQFTRISNPRKSTRGTINNDSDSMEKTQPSISTTTQENQDDSLDETTYGNQTTTSGDYFPSSSIETTNNTTNQTKRKKPTSSQEITTRINSLPSPPTEGLRRSKRTKIPPLAYWRNERVIYTKASQLSSDLDDPDTTLARDIHNIPLRSIKEVVHVPEPQGYNYSNRRTTKRKQSQHKSIITPISPTSSDDQDEPIIEKPNVPGASWLKNQVLQLNIPEHGKFVEKAIAYSSDYGTFRSPAIYNEEDGTTSEDPNLKIATLFNDIIGNCAVGMLELKGLKPPVKITSSTYFLLVVKGTVEVLFNDESFIVTKGCNFCIPSGSEYGLKNIGQFPALLHFVQVRDEEIVEEVIEER
ncbi:MIF2 [Candida jiufengensis]|uniref:MIF2 n=1 Tax=Candida jiufengensis TaxID=497108 RepID=UPI0022247F90|nr:MIF2 [Candida jiufengensis]KAI5957002.1 MIF2 [Candida jiufengensis]